MARIFCFTSTGNSLYTAKEIADKIDAVVEPMSKKAVPCGDDVIGFVFPVFFWGLPRIVERFISSLQITNKDTYIFAIATCGGPAVGVLGIVKKLLELKNVSLHYGVNLQSVGNYIPGYKVNDSEAIKGKVDERIAKIASDIKDRKTNRPLVFLPMNKLIYKFYPDANSDQFFNVASTCMGCSTCQKICPVDNISMNHGKPEFQHNCEHCLACVHSCPVCAIDWKQKTQEKTRYRNAGITLDDLISFKNDKQD